jgi:hypothetical protein
MPDPGAEGGERQRGSGDQQIAADAVDDGEEDLAFRPGPPDRVERQLSDFPHKMSRAGKRQI